MFTVDLKYVSINLFAQRKLTEAEPQIHLCTNLDSTTNADKVPHMCDIVIVNTWGQGEKLYNSWWHVHILAAKCHSTLTPYYSISSDFTT